MFRYSLKWVGSFALLLFAIFSVTYMYYDFNRDTFGNELLSLNQSYIAYAKKQGYKIGYQPVPYTTHYAYPTVKNEKNKTIYLSSSNLFDYAWQVKGLNIIKIIKYKLVLAHYADYSDRPISFLIISKMVCQAIHNLNNGLTH